MTLSPMLTSRGTRLPLSSTRPGPIARTLPSWGFSLAVSGMTRPEAAGLVIPDTAKEKPQEGKVLAIGPGRVDDNGNRVPLDVSIGDKVIYSKYGGTEVKYGGVEYLILSARDVLAIIEK